MNQVHIGSNKVVGIKNCGTLQIGRKTAIPKRLMVPIRTIPWPGGRPRRWRAGLKSWKSPCEQPAACS